MPRNLLLYSVKHCECVEVKQLCLEPPPTLNVYFQMQQFFAIASQCKQFFNGDQVSWRLIEVGINGYYRLHTLLICPTVSLQTVEACAFQHTIIYYKCK